MKQIIQFWRAFGIALCTLATVSPSEAQIVPDRTLEAESSIVTPSENINGTPFDRIDGGAIRGTNLFHSFSEFNINEGQGAYFTNPYAIENILTRVTGSNPSNISGRLGVLGNANLFLINPNGIIFGPNAQLDLRGSFIGSTANSLNFADGTQFSATDPQTAPLLTVSVPVGLQFGANPAKILNKSQFNSSEATNSFFLPIGLQVQPGKTLALIGGDVVLEGGNLTAPGGRIELGSVAGPSLVSINPTNNGWSFGYEGVQNFQDILLSQRAIVDASGFGGGNIRVQGRRVTLTDSSQIGSENLGGLGSGGNLIVNASKAVELIGESGIFTGATDSGVGGNLTIATRQLIVRNGAFISTNTFLDVRNDDLDIGGALRSSFGRGQGGVLNVTASESVELSGTSENGFTSGLFTQATGTANAGDLSITTGKLVVRDGARVSVSSQGAGNAGDLEVVARSIQLNNQAAFTAESASGNGGDIRLQAQNIVLLSRNSMISAISGTQDRGGNAGNITIDTDLFIASENSDIIANSFAGPGANVQITAREFLLSSNSEIIVNEKEVNIEPVESVVGLKVSPTEVVDPSGLIVQGCPADVNIAGRGGSKFIVTGRGGLPPTPRETLNSDTVLEDWGTSALTSNQPVSQNQGDRTDSNSPTPSTSAPIVPATGWMISTNGVVTLTAQSPTVMPHNPGCVAKNREIVR